MNAVRIGLGVSAAALAAVVTGCGTAGTENAAESSAPATTPQSTSAAAPTTESATTSAPDEATGTKTADTLCKSGDLKLTMGQGDAGAGTVYRPLIFTNVSDHPCVIQGFPGVSYVAGEDGHQVGAPAVRKGEKGGAFTLNNGDTAYAEIGFVNVQNYDTVTCQPQQVRGLRIYPPQETASMFVELPTTGCASDKIPGEQLTVKTIEKGNGGGR
ncbi:hypothetical protein HNR02_001577 [Amycolatopsis endophytica]|uniref:DUF4232 domain-containing protein n=1 Tax=Amycolatopsis endophytica TaxID=860233 RepID=A0A853B088_9PSEU|nr:DUF4232 domain-containing protein [Amycolatopsis endophytica]NYI88254.1 hypothetical protein [Amycolatopsis endophytica]